MIKNKLRKQREKLGKTVLSIAERIGVRESTVSKWERGVTVPSSKYIRGIERAYEMPWHDIMEA